MARLALTLAALVALSLCSACAPTLGQRRTAAGGALQSLQAGSFEDAERQAAQAIAADPENPFATLVRAVARYERTMHQLSLDVRTAVLGAVMSRGVNVRYLDSALFQAEESLAAVEQDLAVASVPGISLELCLACWKVDWNGSGRFDRSDQALMEIEQGADGRPIPDGDPRRRPTFRFDEGDVAWARAFVSFQRAALDLALAYDWSPLNRALDRLDEPRTVTFPLAHRERIDQARARILEGLDLSDRTRRAYLAETDDDREWVPNPRQKSHPVPLPVDDALYATWEAVLGDLRKLVQGEAGVDLAEISRLAGDDERRVGAPPEGCLDLGAMLTRPKDLVIDLGLLKRSHLGAAQALGELFGPTYVRKMPASALPGRLARMKGEIERHEEELGRKLRYLLWLN